MFRDLNLILGRTGFAIFFLLLSIPLLWPTLAAWEGRVLPVVKNVHVVEVAAVELSDYGQQVGLVVSVSFDKVRQCDFVGLNWFNQFGERLPVLFEDFALDVPTSRPVLSDQAAGPWTLIGVRDLGRTVAITEHRCHPLWRTYTEFFP